MLLTTGCGKRRRHGRHWREKLIGRAYPLLCEIRFTPLFNCTGNKQLWDHVVSWWCAETRDLTVKLRQTVRNTQHSNWYWSIAPLWHNDHGRFCRKFHHECVLTSKRDAFVWAHAAARAGDIRGELSAIVAMITTLTVDKYTHRAQPVVAVWTRSSQRAQTSAEHQHNRIVAVLSGSGMGSRIRIVMRIITKM